MTIEQRVIFGNEFKEARNKIGMSQEELGEKLGYVKQSISNWENGKSEVPNDVIEKINEILKTNISKKAFMELEDKKMRNTKIKSLEDIDNFEDYMSVFDEIVRMVIGKDSNAEAVAIVLKKFLVVASTLAIIEKKREKWDADENIFGITAYKLLTIINENSFEEALGGERSDRIEYQLKEAKKIIMDSYSNIFNFGELDDIVLEKRHEEELGDYAKLCVEDIISILPKTENSFMTTMMVYLIEMKRAMDQF